MTEPTVSHTPSGADPTLGALVHDLTTQVPELIRSEIRLAQAEVAEKGKRAGYRHRDVQRGRPARLLRRWRP